MIAIKVIRVQGDEDELYEFFIALLKVGGTYSSEELWLLSLIKIIKI